MKFLLVLALVLLSFSLEVVDFFPPRDKLRAPITKPIFHPYESDEQLEKVQAADPIGFDIDNYKQSMELFKILPASNGDSDFPSFEDEVEKRNVAKKTITSYKVSGKSFPGTINLDDYENEIISLECTKIGEFTIVSEDLDFLKSILPGSRIHFGFEWSHENPKCKEEFISSHYQMVTLRKDFKNQSPFSLTFETEELQFHDMFHTVSVDLEEEDYEPTEDEIEEQRRIDKDIREKLLFFGFNYDEHTEQVIDRTIDLYKDSYNRITCENCYAYLDAGIALKLKSSWLSIKEFRIGVFGKAAANFELKYDFDFHFSKNFKKNIWTQKFHSIKFMVGQVPIYITPAIELDTEMNAKVDVEFEMSTKFTYDKEMELALHYNKGEGMTTEKIISPTHMEFTKPTIKPTSAGHVSADIKVVPKVLLYLYAVAPVQITATPKAYFQGEVTTKKMDYQTFYSVDAHLSIDPLEIPEGIPEIGGKTYDFGCLPFAKEWTIVPKTPIPCSFCQGEVSW